MYFLNFVILNKREKSWCEYIAHFHSQRTTASSVARARRARKTSWFSVQHEIFIHVPPKLPSPSELRDSAKRYHPQRLTSMQLLKKCERLI